jgi:hypothetical protein
MTIEFNCPHCDTVLAFEDKYAGKRAKCLTCQQKCIIPNESFQKAKKIIPPKEKSDPVPGYYRAVFIDTWQIFFDRDNLVTGLFLIAIVCFKYFTPEMCCMNKIVTFAVWGWLLGFYFSLMNDTAFESDKLPEIELGYALGFVWSFIWPFIVFLYTMFIVQLPFFIAFLFLRTEGMTFTSVLKGDPGTPLLLRILFYIGLFIFPTAILTMAISKDMTLLRPDYLFIPVLKAFMPYLTAVLLLVAAYYLDTKTTTYISAAYSEMQETVGTMTAVFQLAVNMFVQVLAIFAMRAIGLFYRHYACHFKW